MRFILVLIIALAGHPAWAQVWDPAYRGSGQRAGGPAYLLNDGGYGPGWGYAPGWSYGRGRYGYRSPAYRGSGQRARGPAYLRAPRRRPLQAERVIERSARRLRASVPYGFIR